MVFLKFCTKFNLEMSNFTFYLILNVINVDQIIIDQILSKIYFSLRSRTFYKPEENDLKSKDKVSKMKI